MPSTKTPTAAAAATAVETTQSATGPGTAADPLPTLSVPDGVTVVFAERKRTGRIAGARYKADGTPYKRPGPPPKPPHEKAAYKQRAAVKRMERSYTDQRRKEAILFLENHKIACDENDMRARRTWNGGREDQQPPAEKGYRWPTLREASEWFKVPERTIHSWWKRRDKIFGRVPRKLTKVELRRAAEEEERKRKEDGERRALLEAIGWPRERLPAGAPGGDRQGEATEGFEGPSQPGTDREGGTEGVQMQGERQSEPLSVAGVSSSGETHAAAVSAASSEGSIAGGTPAASLPAVTPEQCSPKQSAAPTGQVVQGARAVSVATATVQCLRPGSVFRYNTEGGKNERTLAANASAN